MPRYDKYDPKVGGFRARLAANFGYTGGVPDWNHADLGVAFGVGLNSSGQIVKGVGVAPVGIVGVLILTRPKAAGDVIDPMTDGEIVEWETSAGAAGITATVYTANTTTGLIDATAASATQIKVGWTVEASRLIVRLGA